MSGLDNVKSQIVFRSTGSLLHCLADWRFRTPRLIRKYRDWHVHPAGACEPTSRLLAALLYEERGISTEYVYGSAWDGGGYHCFLKIGDWTLDPTIGQFADPPTHGFALLSPASAQEAGYKVLSQLSFGAEQAQRFLVEVPEALDILAEVRRHPWTGSQEEWIAFTLGRIVTTPRGRFAQREPGAA